MFKFREGMMERMMNSMSSEEKKTMMEKMMNSFFSGMSEKEKKDMRGTMMPSMMKQMMGGDTGMMGMMSMMMGSEGESSQSQFKPWEMCQKMAETLTDISDNLSLITPEIRFIFNEWCEKIEEEIQGIIESSDAGDIGSIADKVKLSPQTVSYFVLRLIEKGVLSKKFTFK
ncbi:MAG: winged helix-turn-helix domain-containing protein [Chitinivibrionales bacterium]|nr:winged helix-turn-helix domain-containing protein [Chitinivibrionales bacterium]